MPAPNLLFLLTDQQSASMMGCAGNPWVRTPNLDFLARHGVRFPNAYCANPVCLPSRFSLINGIYPGSVGLRRNDWKFDVASRAPNLLANTPAKRLAAAGYENLYGGVHHFVGGNAGDYGYHYYCKDDREALAIETAQRIRNRPPGSKPFAITASFVGPHDICLMAINDYQKSLGKPGHRLANGEIPREVTSVLKAAEIPEGMNPRVFFDCVCPPLPDNYLPADDEPEGVAILQAERPFKKWARENYTGEQWRLHRWAYARLVESVDAQIGVVLDALIKSGQWDNTVILFTSDHGDMDASHKMEHKECLYQECCNVPMILKGLPGDLAGIVDDRLVVNGPDCVATMLDYALEGERPREPLEGERPREPGFSLRRPPPARDAVVVECENGIMAVGRRYKYARYDKGVRNEQFYDLLENPGEMHNQIHDPRYHGELAKLRAVVAEHQNNYDN